MRVGSWKAVAARGKPWELYDLSVDRTELSDLATREPERLVDTLICCALIEARSCERMKLLADGLHDAELASFYRELLAAEARHHSTYLDLAASLSSRAQVRERTERLAAHEASLVAQVPSAPDRLHA